MTLEQLCAETFSHWQLELDAQGILWLSCDRKDETTNTLGEEVITELGQILGYLAQSQPEGLVLQSAKSSGFIAGADIREFEHFEDAKQVTAKIRQGHTVFSRLETLPVPTVAAVSGFCLGGGLELALCCDYIIAQDREDTRVGLPEVKLGIFPGLGGSVRLCERLGGLNAMPLMLTGRLLRARAARAAGLVDQVIDVHQSLHWHARKAILQKRRRKKPGLIAKLSNAGFIRNAIAAVMERQTRAKVRPEHYPAPFRLIDTWRQFGGYRQAMFDAEAEAVGELMVGDTARNLRRVFNLMERMKSLGKSDTFKVKRVHVIGAGVMGGDIAAWCAAQGMDVTLQDREQQYIDPALKRAEKVFRRKFRNDAQRDAAKTRLSADVEGKGIARADVIIEAIYEDLDAKQALLAKVEPILKPGAVLATNTSAIPLESLAEALVEPTRLIGLHFFNPVAKMPLIEVVESNVSTAEYLAKGNAFCTQINRFPLPVKSSPGFLVNRVLAPYLMEAMRCYQEGIDKLDIDEATDLEKLAVSRRTFLKGSVAGATAFMMGRPAMAAMTASPSRLAFTQVETNGLDTVTVPEGYSWHVVGSWGDPLWSNGAEFDHATRGTAASQLLSMGDNTDGMSVFVKNGRTIMAQNNEYVNRSIIYGNRESKLPENEDDVNKGKAGHGVSVFEMAMKEGQWSIVKDSEFNHRITADSPMALTGPAAGHDLLKTAADPSGTQSLGTWNNCGNGRTPWGTYLTCEENFNGYFSSSDPEFSIPAEMQRYGIKHKDWGYAWATADERFDISKHPNEVNRAGYIVEIDPLDPKSTPKKRTALGRFKHENAELVVANNGHVVVYMGDDERGEFLYKFVSAQPMTAGGDNSSLLEDGKLYVAKFYEDGKGRWLELNPETTGLKSQAEICIHTRQAASAAGATTMDRPEWVAANPKKVEAYCCLTNNKNRGRKPNAGGDATPVGGPNPREGNLYGQIVRWVPDNADHISNTFTWDLFVIAGNPNVHNDNRKGSSNVTADNMFNSPDGLAFDSNGLMWIQTDGNYSNKEDFAGQGNNQMLVADPESGEIKRFLVGPKECEVTGITWSGDRRTLFVGIQHPGEKGDSHFPGGGDTVPRSAIIAINRNDGAKIG